MEVTDRIAWGPDSPGYPPAELLRRLIDYNPETGDAFWKARTPDLFFGDDRSKDDQAKSWNSRHAGKPVGSLTSHGYRRCRIFDRTFYFHRVVWAIHHGNWPIVIDHINHDRTDNRIANLRSVTSSINARNGGLLPANKSGVCGVSWRTERRKWYAHIKVSGKMIALGLYADFKDAVAARKAAEIEHGFHANHGFVRIHDAERGRQ